MSKEARLNYLVLGIVAAAWLSMFWGVWIAYPVTVTVVSALTLIMNLHAMESKHCGRVVSEAFESSTRCVMGDGHYGDCRDFWGGSRKAVGR